MTLKALGAASLALLLVASASQAFAATKAAAPAARPAAATSGAPRPAAPPINHGPALAGVCLYSNDRAIGASVVGKAAAARIQQLRAQVTAELQAEQQGIQTDGAALNAKKATLAPEQFAQQAQPINARVQALDAKAQLRQRELEATGGKALQRIGAEVEPILRNLYQSRGCSILINAESIIVANPAMDLTPQVAAQLDTKMTTITFEREHLDAAPAAGQ